MFLVSGKILRNPNEIKYRIPKPVLKSA